ncbi:F0F1 ATP synthase subunit alpha [Mycoplasmoides pneumoniae]|uniref:ATP synthase subunit alpha n=2 Tax=Mycoplasmoides pneumoniae TaxID=2104 RepID=ATPA_MYCPN|nr:F0F1 ATP synthase subunit alpha [Mycoplasmoides pneumoniae]Q50329.1 RecName: Full=ATP synthase subunit alpha; AltName: Full=ATP synthase F1 sector subunit alpha; AltName: Full=F-ATPase subunit alpha [Mycoplasmoides pneumoniae M129]AAB95890.1 ATP synthase alpha chain [Mycoplasmoides pneumoniae M129]AAC43657.1 ATP synthase alpha chain [Mycoplasmoides pneumoniae]AGC04474.1 ATP F0F1 synthase subunit alpha [Mycoplasmoides pneumoniae M129-B7]ALA30469.1 ATP F0F1 synthase subunit alpha [Mycoplasmoi
MADKLNEYVALIKNEIKKYSKQIFNSEIGKVISVADGIAKVSGLENALLNELIEFENNVQGIALNLEQNTVGVALFGDYSKIREGSTAKRTHNVMQTPVGDVMLGRIVNALGEPVDGRGPIKAEEFDQVEKIAPGVMTRKTVNQPLETGILTIDALFPIGKGQRELIVGDRQTGKTSIAIDTIINQRGKDVYCVYVAMGQKNSSVAQIVHQLEVTDSMKYTTVVCATASDPASMIYLTPFTGITIAEYWLKQGKDVLIVFDDLSKHAIAYRTLSLLLRRPPGREAFPGDVFYLHSRLLERACRLNEEHGGGSITALPIIETQAGDISAYIPTNVISITDGQLFMVSNLFNSGQRPAIHVGLSVSRVGSAAQIKAIKQQTGSLKLELAQYSELDSFSQFGSDLDENTKQILERGKRVMEMIKQPNGKPYSQTHEALFLFAIAKSFIKFIPLDYIAKFKQRIMEEFDKEHPIYKEIATQKSFSEALEAQTNTAFKALVKRFVSALPDYDITKYGTMEELE